MTDSLSELINEYDTDGSGQIEFPEFCNMMSAKMSEVDDEEMVSNFLVSPETNTTSHEVTI